MKYAIRIVLLVLIAFLAYKTYMSIAEPVRYNKEVDRREAAVIERLSIIKEAQLAFRDVNGRFSDNFNELVSFMKNDSLQVMVAYGDKDDSTTVYMEVMQKISVRDSLFRDIDIDQVRYVPFLDKVEFKIAAGETEQSGVKLPTFEVVDPQPFSKTRQKEKNPLRVGDLNSADYAGNWN